MCTKMVLYTLECGKMTHDKDSEDLYLDQMSQNMFSMREISSEMNSKVEVNSNGSLELSMKVS